MDESLEVNCDSSTVAPGELWRTGRLRWQLWGLLIAGWVWGPGLRLADPASDSGGDEPEGICKVSPIGETN